MRRVLVVLLMMAVVVSLAVTGCAKPAPAPPPEEAPEAKVTKWIMQASYGQPTATWYGSTVPWVDMVETATKETVQIELLPINSICGISELFGAVSTGAIDLTVHYAPAYGGDMPEAYLAYGLARGTRSTEEHHELMFEYGLADIVNAAFAKHNLQWIGWASTQCNAGFGDFPVNKWEDYKNKKCRAGGPQAAFLEGMTGVPVAINWGDIYMAMQLGTIDGFFSDLPSIEGMKFYEVAKYIHFPAWLPSQHQEIFCNLDSWNALEQWQRDAISGVFEEHYWLADSLTKKLYTSSLKVALDWGTKISEMSEEEVRRMDERCVEVVWPAVAELSPGCAQGVEIYMQFMRDKGRL